MAITYEPIATTTLASTSTTITFTSVPSTYTDLRLVLIGKNGVGSNSVRLRFNSDTATNYSRNYMEGDGTTASGGRNQNATSIIVGDNGTTVCFSTVDIFSYTTSGYKTVICKTANDKNGTGTVNQTIGLWRGAAAINTIEFSMADPFSIGTMATLYGIKAA